MSFPRLKIHDCYRVADLYVEMEEAMRNGTLHGSMVRPDACCIVNCAAACFAREAASYKACVQLMLCGRRFRLFNQHTAGEAERQRPTYLHLCSSD